MYFPAYNFALPIKVVIQSTSLAAGETLSEDQMAVCTFYQSHLSDGFESIKGVTNGRGINAHSLETTQC